MSVLKRLYRYVDQYRVWAIIAFGSMIIFAISQTVMIALSQPLFDEVLTRPTTQVSSQDSTTKRWILDIVLKRNKREGKRGLLINTFDRTQRRFDAWWNANQAD